MAETPQEIARANYQERHMDKDTVTYVVTDSKELTHRVRADRGFSVITNGVLELYRDGHIVACFNSDSWLSVVEES